MRKQIANNRSGWLLRLGTAWLLVVVSYLVGAPAVRAAQPTPINTTPEDARRGTDGFISGGACAGQPAGTSCGDPSETDCDDPDTCDGAGNCLRNSRPGGTPCGDPSDTECDNPDTCDATGICHPNNEPDGTPCNVETPNPGSCISGTCVATGGIPCADPPPGMVAWWPGDGTPNDIVNSHHGSLFGSTTYTIGKVGTAFAFGDDDFVSIPSADDLNPKSHDFTLDAWFRTGIGTICGKHGSFLLQAGFQPPGQFSISLNLQEDTGDQHGVHSGINLPSSEPWTHVAFTLDRTNEIGRIFLNGQEIRNFVIIMDNIESTGDLRLGHFGDPFIDGNVSGIDEVEIFHRALDASEIEAIYRAGSWGKCRDGCHVPWDTPFCESTATHVVVPITICNYSSSAETYNISIAALPIGAGCSVPGPSPTDFRFPDNDNTGVFVPPDGGCRVVRVEIKRPAGLNFNAAVACFEVSVTDPQTGLVRHKCRGSVQDRRRWCGKIADGVGSGVHDIIMGTARGTGTSIDFEIWNIGDPTGVFNYEFATMYSHGSSVIPPVRLNGLPPGIHPGGSIMLAVGESAILPVTVEYEAFDPFDFTDLMLLADLDGDGNITDSEALVSTGVRVVRGESEIVPLLSEWGFVALALVLLCAAKIRFGQRRALSV